nr:hypothetical protein [Tanacetum cinerariifolium]
LLFDTVVAYLSSVLEGNRLHKGTSNHWKKHTFNRSGGLRLKHDISEYGDFVRSFNAATVDEKIESFSIVLCYKAKKMLVDEINDTVERLLSPEQKVTDYNSSDDGVDPDHLPISTCGNRLHKGTSHHWKKHTFNQSGGLRLKRDIFEYGDFVRSFNAATVDEKFESFSIMANVFFVAPESLSSLFEGTCTKHT